MFHGDGVNMFHGSGIRDSELKTMLRHYKMANHLPVNEDLPAHHTLQLFSHGAEGRGGFLPFAALLPMLGSALSTIGPALATGAVGALGAAGTNALLNKLRGNGLPFMYHKGTESWHTHGEGLADIFKKIIGKVGSLGAKAIANNSVKKIGAAGRDALINQTISALEDYAGGNKKPAAETPAPAKKKPSTSAGRKAGHTGTAKAAGGHHHKPKKDHHKSKTVVAPEPAAPVEHIEEAAAEHEDNPYLRAIRGTGMPGDNPASWGPPLDYYRGRGHSLWGAHHR